MIARGQKVSGDALGLEMSSRWKALTPEERAPFDELARRDKARVQEAAAALDAEALRVQEEKRELYSGLAESRMRGSTTANTIHVAETLPQRKKRNHRHSKQGAQH